MYARPDDRITDVDEMWALAERAAFGHLVTFVDGAFAGTGLPLLVDRPEGETPGVLRGHVARANAHWHSVDGAPCLVVLPLADGYVSPSWYASKAVDGRVVPTWNYEVVHAHGTAHVHDDADWVLAVVDGLTERHESSRSSSLGGRWAVSDAPADYIERMLRAIVGVSVTVDRIEAKRKLSVNRSAEDRAGVMDGLAGSTDPRDHRLREAMRGK